MKKKIVHFLKYHELKIPCGVDFVWAESTVIESKVICKNCLKIMGRERQNKIAIEDAQRLSEIIAISDSELWPMNS
jgi:hypothetical protein